MDDLRKPAHYLPFANGRYEIKAGLYKLGHDFGNGPADKHTFQIDNAWSFYRAEKLTARARHLDRYVCCNGLDNSAERDLVKHISTQMCREHPAYFQCDNKNNLTRLRCCLSGETLELGEDFRLIGNNSAVDPAYLSALDALACQTQEDLAFMDNGSPSRLRWLHLCFPNHWAAQDKIGKDFIAIHEPVAGIEHINTRAQALMASLAQQGPYVRFAWGLTSDPRLDRHPLMAASRDFTEDGALYIRVERQVTVPIPGRGFLFTIRTYILDSTTLSAGHSESVWRAVQSMSAASKRYKGIAGHEGTIFSLLQHHAGLPRT